MSISSTVAAISYVQTYCTYLLKESFGSVIVLNVLIHPGLLRGEGCAVITEQQGIPRSNLHVHKVGDR